MKVFQFIRWQWQQFETWQKCYIFGAFLMGAGVVTPSPYDKYLFALPVAMLFCWTAKWWIWDALKNSYQKFLNEQNSLFTTIKESDK